MYLYNHWHNDFITVYRIPSVSGAVAQTNGKESQRHYWKMFLKLDKGRLMMDFSAFL